MVPTFLVCSLTPLQAESCPQPQCPEKGPGKRLTAGSVAGFDILGTSWKFTSHLTQAVENKHYQTLALYYYE